MRSCVEIELEVSSTSNQSLTARIGAVDIQQQPLKLLGGDQVDAIMENLPRRNS
jgi:hypothetical protein